MVLTQFWPVLGHIWYENRWKTHVHDTITYNLNWLIKKAKRKIDQAMIVCLKIQFWSILMYIWPVFWQFWSNFFCKNCPGYHNFCSADQVQAFGYTIRQLFIDCVLEIPISAHFEYLRFLFLPLEWNNFWMAGPIISRRRPVDLSEKTLYFRHQFFVFISKNVWVMV